MTTTGQSATDDAIAGSIERLLAARRAGATICPSEVARDLHGGEDADWRPAMPEVRRVAAAMAAAGHLRVTRKGVEVEAESPGGPIRLGRPDRRTP